MKQYIEFKKQRELGDILSDTFAFIRTQFNPFFSTFFKIVGPYLLVMLICMGFYMYSFQSVLDFNTETANELFNGGIMMIAILLFFVSMVLAYTLSHSTVLHYIKSYANNGGKINFDEIRQDVYRTFWSFVGLGILFFLSLMAGLMLCIIPGIYLYVPLVLSFCVMVFMRKSATEAYSYSFTLVKDHWWLTFAYLMVVGIIVGVAGYAFQIPTFIYQWVKMGIFSGEVDAENLSNLFIDPIYLLLNLISVAAQFMLNLISIIAGVFIFFDLNEKKNFTGTYERIQNLGRSSNE